MQSMNGREVVAQAKALACGNWHYIHSATNVIYKDTPKHQACPVCGGKDKFRFDNQGGRGTFYCNDCGSGDGFKLIQNVHQCSFKTALNMVKPLIGMSGGRSISNDDIEKAKANAELKQKEQLAKDKAHKDRALLIVNDIVKNYCQQATANNAYLQSKGIQPHDTLELKTQYKYKDNDYNLNLYKGSLIIPIFDKNQLVNVESINAYGNKTFIKSAPFNAPFYPIRGKQNKIFIGEGFATCASANELTGQMSVTAFNANNMMKVGLLIRQVRPHSDIIFLADDDKAGVKNSEAAAAAVNGFVVYAGGL